MRKPILIAVGLLSLGTAAHIWLAPQHWYDTVPGVSMTGPLNLHFARDVGLALLVSGAALIWAALTDDRSAGVIGASWLLLHALFHIWIWVHRGFPADLIALVNLLGIQLPAFLAFAAASGLTSKGETR
ncbi:hypothetical protein [Aestuariivita boseongensis]|uniref:hypothetical protein n=1 Tax=Aestuariivita boseongensis TaxID=1470562 RepID=UPI000682C17B|nr:hypothetical protein [Aestuariivita boseongensis]